MNPKIIMQSLALIAVIGTTATATVTGGDCGNDFNLVEFKFIQRGPITAERCQGALEIVERNRDVLKRSRCVLEEYKDWKDDANKEAREKLDELINKLGDLVVPSLKQGSNLATTAGKLNFANKVIDLMQAQEAALGLLINSQGGAVFEGMLGTVRNDIRNLTRYINRILAWHESNCPPLFEEEPFLEPLDPPPPAEEPEEVVEDKPKKADEEKLSRLPKYQRQFMEWITRNGKTDLTQHQITGEQWEHALGLARPFGLVGFIQILQEGLLDELLGRHNLDVLEELGLNRLNVDFVDEALLDDFYNGFPNAAWMELEEVEETRGGQHR